MDNNNKKLVEDIISRAKEIKDIDPRGALVYAESCEKLEILVGGDIRAVLYTLTHLISRISNIYGVDSGELMTIIDGALNILEKSNNYKVDLSEVIEIDEEDK